MQNMRNAQMQNMFRQKKCTDARCATHAKHEKYEDYANTNVQNRPFHTKSAEAIKGRWYYLFLFLIYSPGETSEVYSISDMVIVSKYKRST